MKKRTILLALTIAILSAAAFYFFFNHSFLVTPASVEMRDIDRLLRLMMGIAAVIFTLIVSLLVFILLRSRRSRTAGPEGRPSSGNLPLELVWTLIPLAIVMGIAGYGGVVLDRMTHAGPHQPELEVHVVGARFSFAFRYPAGGMESTELVLPADRTVLLRMTSLDVVHSFWVPELGPKQDIVPGITTELRLTPDRPGTYKALCAEQCGLGHSFMSATVRVVSAGDFASWVETQKAPK
ncbi:MAG: cytochrome c oxidase subunit II [Chloroflexi bacterium]|nr:cytochrome c oxidase subunit II [Chloroflexota bacterium]